MGAIDRVARLMQWQGVQPKDMTSEQLDAATAYTEKAIQDCAAHYSLLMVGYEELAAEHQRRQDRETNKALN